MRSRSVRHGSAHARIAAVRRLRGRRRPCGSRTSNGCSTSLRRRIATLDGGDDPSAFTQAEIARTTGLAPATVSNIVRDLTATGLVDTTAGQRSPRHLVRLAPEAGTVAGVDFGHSHVAVALGDLTGSCWSRSAASSRRPTTTTRARTWPPRCSHQLLAARRTADACAHVGLGLPAPVTDDDRRLHVDPPRLGRRQHPQGRRDAPRRAGVGRQRRQPRRDRRAPPAARRAATPARSS